MYHIHIRLLVLPGFCTACIQCATWEYTFFEISSTGKKFIYYYLENLNKFIRFFMRIMVFKYSRIRCFPLYKCDLKYFQKKVVYWQIQGTWRLMNVTKSWNDYSSLIFKSSYFIIWLYLLAFLFIRSVNIFFENISIHISYEGKSWQYMKAKIHEKINLHFLDQVSANFKERLETRICGNDHHFSKLPYIIFLMVLILYLFI